MTTNFTKTLKVILALYKYLQRLGVNDLKYIARLKSYVFDIDINKPCTLNQIQ